MSTINIRQLVADYIKYRLRKEGLDERWKNCPTLTDQGIAHFTMRTIGSEFELRYNAVFTHLANQLHITPDTAQMKYFAIVQELFHDGINWGRIVALFSFSGCLAVHCVQKEMPAVVDHILEWTAAFVEHRLNPWIAQHGGWNGFVEYFDRFPEHRNESPWNTLTKIAGFTLGAIGAVTLGAIFVSKT